MTVEEVLDVTGRRALARLGSRVTLVYLAAAALGVLVGTPADERDATARPAALVLACALAASLAVGRLGPPRPPPAHAARAPRRWPPVVPGLVAVVAGAVAVRSVAAAGNVLGEDRVEVLAGWLLPGVALGLALAAGPLAGVAALLGLAVVLAAVAPHGLAVVPAALGAGVSVAVGSVVHVVTRRGYATTDAALTAAAQAQVARARAASRLRARRRLDRALHDTLLSTLSLLAHGGRGVDAHLLRTACARDLAALRSDRWSDPPDLVVDLTAGDLTPPPEPEPDLWRGARGTSRVPVPRRPDALSQRLTALRALAAAGGVDLRVHAPPAAAALGPAVLEAWAGALTECVSNVVRHAGVAAADVALGCTDDALVTVVVDEGAGFDPDQVPAERLGLANSVRERLRDVGGDVRVWSRPGHGTVVELLAPLRRSTGARPADRRIVR